jgi:signal transduction histidine kinase
MVEKPRRLIQDTYTRHKLIIGSMIVLLQIIATTVFGGALVIAGILTPGDTVFWLLLAIAFMTNILMSIVLISVALDPLDAVTRALSHIASEPSALPPPNPNILRYRYTGTKELIDLIYLLGARRNNLSPAPATDKSSSSLIDSALDPSKSSLVIFDPDGTISYASKQAPVVDGMDGSRRLNVVFDSSDIDLLQWRENCKAQAINAEKIWTRVHTDPDSNATHRIYDIAATFSRDSPTELLLVVTDRTASYEPEEKDLDFIAFAAHELRGPITVIRGYLDVFDDELTDELSDDQRLLLGRLIVSANRLSTYINNILNVSRYDRRHYKVELSRQKLADIYDSISDDMSSRARTQNRLLLVNIPADLPDVAADPSSLCEVFANLIDNAIKYSSEGGSIEVTARTEGSMVEVDVKDHGIGMPDSVVQNLFHKFYRSHRSRESVAGSGIGLYISKAIIESHGGNIGVRSSEDKGSTFTFSIPTYESVEHKLKKGDNGNNEALIQSGKSWISNHNMYRG